MANSVMQLVSDGSLSTIPLTIKFFEQGHIGVYIDDVALPADGYSYVWSGATTITITPAVTFGAQVSIRRQTPADYVLHEFQAGAVFSEASIDDNFRQDLFLLQEAKEQSLVTDLFTDIDMHGNKVRNLGSAILGGDATPLSQVQQIVSASDGNPFVYAQLLEALRRSYAEIGFNLVDGSFEAGGALVNDNDVLLQARTGKAFSGPVGTVAAGTNPSSGGFVDVSGSLLKGTVDAYASRVRLTSFYENTTEGLNKALSDAVSGGRSIVADSSMSVNGTGVSKLLTEVSITGSEAISGPYRKKVVDEFRQPFVPVNTLNPDRDLKMLRTTTTPVVVMMGDSISTEGPNAITLADSMWSAIKTKMVKDNPSKSLTFHNRGIGGQTWLHANSIPTAFPYWYTNTSNTWLSYIEALAPDVVFLAFGMNDSNGFNAGALVSVVNKIKLFAKVPDIVFVTNPVPAQTAIYPDGTGFGFVGQTFQEGRDYAAGYARSFANTNGYGLIDINRSMVAMRDCYDVTSGVMRKIEQVSAANYTAASSASDFSFRCSCDGAAWAEGKVLAIKCGLEANDFIFVKKVSGNFVVEGFAAGSSTYKSINTGISVPSISFGFEISVLDGTCRLIIDPLAADFANKRVIAEFSVIRHGGIFLPVISWQGESSGPFTDITYSSGYRDAKYKQSVTDSDVWGASGLSASTKEPYGGNGINHYSAEGIALVVRPTIEACDFAAGETLTGIHAGGRWTKFADGQSIYQKTVTFAGDVSSAVGSIFMAADTSDTDFPTGIFMPDGDGGYVFSQAINISSATGGLWIGSSATTRNAIRYRIASALSRTGVTATVHITLTGRWK